MQRIYIVPAVVSVYHKLVLCIAAEWIQLFFGTEATFERLILQCDLWEFGYLQK